MRLPVEQKIGAADVLVEPCADYVPAAVDEVMHGWDPLFSENIRPGDVVVLKPNWIAPSHKYNKKEWQSVITHPVVISSVLNRVLSKLKGRGRVVITDGPQTQSSWSEIMARQTPDIWTAMGREAGVPVEILDLREDEWITDRDVIVSRKKLEGDPLGSTECDLGDFSEFVTHRPGPAGYCGADYDRQDTNEAHSNGRHKYKVSRTVIAADVFVNLPKLKTHKKAGITASLKNLVGINTYKNWLPHHTEGTPDQGGDQFPRKTVRTSAEGRALESVRRLLSSHAELGRWIAPLKSIGKLAFGDTRETIRNGAWYGNDTLWRMILDLNKILLFANPDGSLRPAGADQRKRYITIVDAIIAGEGNGPEAPDPKRTALLIAGVNAATVDSFCARVMGFDWAKIPSIKRAFDVAHYPIAGFGHGEIRAVSSAPEYCGACSDLDYDNHLAFRPHFGWAGHVEL